MNDMTQEQAEVQGGKKYKVAVLQMRADLYTIYAKDPEEAVKLVTIGDEKGFSDRFGRPAGEEGPIVVSAMAREVAAGPHPPFLEMFLQALGARPAPQTSPIQVPRLVMPEGLG